MVTDITIKQLLALASGDLDGHFLVVVEEKGISFHYFTKDQMEEMKLACGADKEAQA